MIIMSPKVTVILTLMWALEQHKGPCHLTTQYSSATNKIKSNLAQNSICVFNFWMKSKKFRFPLFLHHSLFWKSPMEIPSRNYKINICAKFHLFLTMSYILPETLTRALKCLPFMWDMVRIEIWKNHQVGDRGSVWAMGTCSFSKVRKGPSMQLV